MKILKLAAVAATGLALTLPALAPAAAAGNKKAAASYGKPTGSAKMNVNKPKPSANYQKPAGKNVNTGNRQQNNNYNRPNTKPGQRPGGSNVVAGNTVVVGRPPTGNGYYNNGNYNNRPDWDDDDDDFLEFVGKTAAITAGVSVVTAVIGSVVNEKPSGDCQPVVANGQQYLNCNGTYYLPATQAGPTSYQVVAPPAQ